MQKLIFYKLVHSLLPDAFIFCFLEQKVKIVISTRPSSAVRPVGLWPDHFFARNGFSRNTFLAGPFSHVSSRPSLMIYFSMIKD